MVEVNFSVSLVQIESLFADLASPVGTCREGVCMDAFYDFVRLVGSSKV